MAHERYDDRVRELDDRPWLAPEPEDPLLCEEDDPEERRVRAVRRWQEWLST